MKYYAFIGQLKTTCGLPHNVTGRMNTYGDLVVFYSYLERKKFLGYISFNNPNTHAYSTSKKEAKIAFFGGMTQIQFDDYLKLVDSGYVSISKFTC